MMMLDRIEARLGAMAAMPVASDVEYGDHMLNPGTRHLLVRPGLRDAAVLIGLVQRAEGPTVILTRRSAQMRQHTGQIAFPGGGIDAGDGGPVAAALREAEEEIGLPRSVPVPIGQLPDYVTGSGYRIRPVIALVPDGLALQPNPAEVDEAFEVPLAFLMDPANHVQASREWMGHERFFFQIDYGRHHIWGATAGIIRSFYERVVA